MPGKCVFNDLWLRKEQYKGWLANSGTNDRHTARCTLCWKTFDIGNMGEAAVVSHMKGKKHHNLVSTGSSSSGENANISDFFSASTTSKKRCTKPDAAVGNTNTEKQQGTLTNAVCNKDDQWKAEILWSMKTVVDKYSYKSCENVSQVFQKMFPDSTIAKHFTCGERKCAYIVCFGLAPYFRTELMDKVIDSEYVLLFDESLNHHTQNKQLDICVRFFDSSDKRVTTRYFDSGFIGHATADDMMEHFIKLTERLKLNNMIQVSMDGPNVNWSFYEKLSAELKTVDSAPSLINIGSCGLHIVHGAFKGAFESVDWDVAGLLKAMHTLFKDTPARREDYEKINGCSRYALRHCATRWIEDIPVAKRAIEVLPLMKNYVTTVLKHPKKYTVPKTMSFNKVKEAVEDPMTLVKLQFFVSFAEEFHGFLTKFQTDAPMLPFLSTDLENLLRNLMARCIKEDVLMKADTAPLLLKLNMTDKNILLRPKLVHVGFSATHKLKEFIATKVTSERQELQFRMDCRDMLVYSVRKLLEKCPLKYSLTRNSVCMAPQRMATVPTACKTCFSRVLSTLVNSRRVEEHVCDGLLKEYDSFLVHVVAPNKHKFKDFDTRNVRLDTFYYEYMAENCSYTGLWKVFKLLLILSHGQASVERGFSINKNLMVENMTEKSITSQRVVYDYIQSCGGLLEVPMSKEIILAAQSGRMKYHAYLEANKQKRTESEASRKRSLILDQVRELESKSKRLRDDVQSLLSSADTLAVSAEKKGCLADLTKSNSFRNTAKEKQTELKLTEREITKLKDKSKSMIS